MLLKNTSKYYPKLMLLSRQDFLIIAAKGHLSKLQKYKPSTKDLKKL
jgi:hypothetical protein